MVSRRNFFSICVMMTTIFILFQLLMVSRDIANKYNENPRLTETYLTSESAWNVQPTDNSVEKVIYIGADDTEATIVSQWCNYTKRRFERFDSLENYTFSEDAAVLLCLNEQAVTSNAQANELCDMVKNGQKVLFCDASDPSLLVKFPALKTLLGIKEVVQEHAELTGIRMFSGFLVGGETIYTKEKEETKLDQKVDFSAPWYLRTSGTKSYMVGLLEDESIENEDLPSLIWRNSYGSGRVFVINGPYMQDETGLGIMSAIMYELNEYVFYPVVNAQNISVVNFPIFALENTEELTELYSRNLSQLQNGLIWPSLISALNKSSYRMTTFLTPRLDYSTDKGLSSREFVFYLKQFKEQDAEIGLSFDHLSEISLKDKFAADQEFIDDSGVSYSYGSAYVLRENRDEFLAIEQKGILKDVRTLTGIWSDDLLSYCNDTVVAQGITADGFSHPYLQDLKVRAIETTLGYSNILLDMKRVGWPDGSEPHWEVLAERFASNINTYWNAFSAFDKTTLLESDERIRGFFALDYSDTRRGQTITVDISSENNDNWFILRTHYEIIIDIVGGDYTRIEENVYLIHATESKLQIELEALENKQYFLP